MPPRRLTHTLLASWTALVFAFLYLPIALLILYSFNSARLSTTWESFTTRWYRDLFNNTSLITSALNSLLIAAATTHLSVLLGTLGAWALYRYRWPFANLLRTLLALPLVMPDVVMGVSLLILFAASATWGNAFLLDHNITDTEPLGLGFTTVILGHTTFCFPFVLIAVHARLVGMDPALEEAALDLGATPARAFTRVIVPYLMPAIASGALMSFTLSMDELIVTYFIAGPNSATLPMKIFGLARVGLTPTLNAASALLVTATATLVVAALYINRLKKDSTP